MIQNLNQKFGLKTLKNKEEETSSLLPPINQKNLNFKTNSNPLKSKLPTKKFTTSSNNYSDINFLYLFNNNINPKDYFKKKRIEEEAVKKKQNNQIEDSSKPKNQSLINIHSEDLDTSSFSSFNFSDSEEEDEEIKKEREKSIQKILKKTDILTFIEFDIFDRSKMIDFIEHPSIPSIHKAINKNKKEEIIIDNDDQSTFSTDIINSKIQLIKKAKIKNENKKRINKFQKKEKKIIRNSKSKSIKRNFERSRSREYKQ